eukprot:m.96749 g.96749  ORF g.96749 m.96749 type:complete len:292 (-) comp26919_c0_seq2:245-1120(-)
MATKERVLCIAFNQDHDRFICGLDTGFRIFNTLPEQLEQHDLPNGGIGQVEMLFKCNFIALVGGGKTPCFPTNKVMIWDDRKQKCVIELPFKSEVKAVRLRRDRIVVVLETKTLVYTFTVEPQKIVSLPTCDNPLGLCEMCPDTDNPLLILPGEHRGEVQIIDLLDVTKSAPVIPAHSNNLACFSLNRKGTLLATASEKGTLIRIFETETGKQLHELRRGSSECKISCINFSPDSTHICVSSDKKTVHIFNFSAETVSANCFDIVFFVFVLLRIFVCGCVYCCPKIRKGIS